ncbi:MAG: hypothetical protein MJZ46_07480 [Bacteroidales bacterium]|nr:hypothetical protein [Bacteroidales bacterium]
MKRLFLLLLISLTISYSNAQDTKGDYYTPEIECLGVEEDGSQTLRSWGVGRNKQDAIEQAKKNAVKAVLFKGIQKGNGECNVRPLIYEVNAQEHILQGRRGIFEIRVHGGYAPTHGQEEKKRRGCPFRHHGTRATCRIIAKTN